ncbi:hypothetical protein ccbrp13_15540 [Ktedonobacteria bacterium brp13]|nr:hypothetical protein ccbrp13_15540 [Ktedonobacteria bacterium brp13]
MSGGVSGFLTILRIVTLAAWLKVSIRSSVPLIVKEEVTFFAVLRARLLFGQHVLRQTRRPKPKMSDVLEKASVDDQAGDALPSTLVQLPLPL